MNNAENTITVTVERTIPAAAAEVFEAWLDAKVPGTTWNAADSFLLDARQDGLFYWSMKTTAHYGRFTELARPNRIQHTWVSPSTLGLESNVTITFTPQGDSTVMKLVHSGLPDTNGGRGHENGWNYFMGIFTDQFGAGSRKQYKFEEAHPSEA